jgi:hypothetical protein
LILGLLHNFSGACIKLLFEFVGNEMMGNGIGFGGDG